MGNSPISIGLKTDQSTYTAGDYVTGSVYINVSKQAHPAHSLMIKLVGKERAVIHRTVRDGPHHHHGRHHPPHHHHHHHHHHQHNDESTHIFFQMEYPLHNDFQNQRLVPGQYEYPFSIQLPINLPSTMKINSASPSSNQMRNNANPSECEVYYEIVTTLQQPKTSPLNLSSPFSSVLSSSSSFFGTNKTPIAHQRVTIESRPSTSMIMREEKARYQSVLSMSSQGRLPVALELPKEYVPVSKGGGCCARKQNGCITLEAKLDKTLLQPNDSLQIHFRCENQSTVKVKTVRLQLQQIVTWSSTQQQRRQRQQSESQESGRSRTGVGTNSETVTKILCQKDLDAYQFPGLMKLSRRQVRRLRRESMRRNRQNRIRRHCCRGTYNTNNTNNNLHHHSYQHHDEQNTEQLVDDEFITTANDVATSTTMTTAVDWHSALLQIPAQSYDTYSTGRLIQVRHVLSICLLTKDNCVSNPEISTLVQLYRSIPAATSTATATATTMAMNANGGSVPAMDTTTATDASAVGHHHAPPVQSSAPPDFLDDTTYVPPTCGTATTTTSTMTGATASIHEEGIHHVDGPVPSPSQQDQSVPIVQAQAVASPSSSSLLPPDWNATRAEVVEIPMADAIILGPTLTVNDFQQESNNIGQGGK